MAKPATDFYTALTMLRARQRTTEAIKPKVPAVKTMIQSIG